MTTRILFVCLGNICRSPTAEAVFRAKVKDLNVITDSAGTASYHVGDPPYGAMQHAARRRGYEMQDLRARQFVAEDFDQFDLIVVMDESNLANVERLRGNADTPVHVFTDYSNGSEIEVPDPYYTRDFDGALDLIERCSSGLRASLV
jgi:protein-tyrosine phosphatase